MASGALVSTARMRRQSRPANKASNAHGQCHQAALDAWPGEGVLFEPLVAITSRCHPNQLQPVRLR
ncbi:hypothetical protein AJ87_10415 [Rhizobium yanglingense]|nr:hypothetical protein AJ87_10415 [Rhizobium yanglingense]